jgi:hypothetical protein
MCRQQGNVAQRQVEQACSLMQQQFPDMRVQHNNMHERCAAQLQGWLYSWLYESFQDPCGLHLA